MKMKICLLLFCLYLSVAVSGGEQSDIIEEAIIAGDYKAVINVLDSGLDINKKNQNGRVPIMYAVGIHNSVSDVENVKRSYKKYSKENLVILKMLLDSDADPNIQDNMGKTAIFYSVYHNRLGSTWLLLMNGADLDIKDLNGNTATYYAEYHGYEELVELIQLYKRSAAKDQKGSMGSPISRSLSIGHS
mgnify:CR=1 FL=1